MTKYNPMPPPIDMKKLIGKVCSEALRDKHNQLGNLFYIPMYQRRLLVKPLYTEEGRVKVRDVRAHNKITYLLDIIWFNENAEYAA